MCHFPLHVIKTFSLSFVFRCLIVMCFDGCFFEVMLFGCAQRLGSVDLSPYQIWEVFSIISLATFSVSHSPPVLALQWYNFLNFYLFSISSKDLVIIIYLFLVYCLFEWTLLICLQLHWFCTLLSLLYYWTHSVNFYFSYYTF